MSELQKRITDKGLSDVEVKPYMCFGACQEGPNVVIYPEKNWYAESEKSRISTTSSRISPAVPTCSASIP